MPTALPALADGGTTFRFTLPTMSGAPTTSATFSESMPAECCFRSRVLAAEGSLTCRLRFSDSIKPAAINLDHAQRPSRPVTGRWKVKRPFDSVEDEFRRMLRNVRIVCLKLNLPFRFRHAITTIPWLIVMRGKRNRCTSGTPLLAATARVVARSVPDAALGSERPSASGLRKKYDCHCPPHSALSSSSCALLNERRPSKPGNTSRSDSAQPRRGLRWTTSRMSFR